MEEAEEAAGGAGLVERSEGAGVAPVAEAEAVVLRVAAEHRDEPMGQPRCKAVSELWSAFQKGKIKEQRREI